MLRSSSTASPRRHALAALVAVLCALLLAAALPQGAAAAKSAFHNQGMWIWYVKQAERGNVNKIVAKAKKHKVRTLFVKSSDGSNWWKQWDTYAAKLRAKGIKVCAWQYIYGNYPLVEADLAARAVRSGADCLVINAEVEYQGRYSQARQYVKRLRQQIGYDFPVGFTSFAYPDFHPKVPWSVFLAPGGAQWNLPQMYFWAFKVSVPQVFKHTYSLNQIYQREIHPLGQTYARTPYAKVYQFRKYTKLNRVKGYSWWAWHDTRPDAWKGVRKGLPRVGKQPTYAYPLLKQGNNSDMVRWVKLKLNASGAKLTTGLLWDAKMTAAVRDFQAIRGLPVTGQMDAVTWPHLQEVELPPL